MPKPLVRDMGERGGVLPGSASAFCVLSLEGSWLIGVGVPDTDPSGRATSILSVEIRKPETGQTWTGITRNWRRCPDGTWQWSFDTMTATDPRDRSACFAGESGRFAVRVCNGAAAARGIMPETATAPFVFDLAQAVGAGGQDAVEPPSADAPILLGPVGPEAHGVVRTVERMARFRIRFHPTVITGDLVELLLNDITVARHEVAGRDLERGHVDLAAARPLSAGPNDVRVRLSDDEGNASVSEATCVTLDIPQQDPAEGREPAAGTAQTGIRVALAPGAVPGQEMDVLVRGVVATTLTLSESEVAAGAVVFTLDGAGVQEADIEIRRSAAGAGEEAEEPGPEPDEDAEGAELTLVRFEAVERLRSTSQQPRLRGWATPGVAVTVYPLRGDVPDLAAGVPAQSQPDGHWVATAEPLANGLHGFVAEATDAAGLATWSETLVVEVDCPLEAPEVSLVLVDDGAAEGALPLDAGGRTADRAPLVMGTAQPRAQVELFLNGVPSGCTTADEDGLWEFALEGLGDGAHALTLRSTDASGNRAGDPEGTPAFSLTVGPAEDPAPQMEQATGWEPERLGGLAQLWAGKSGFTLAAALEAADAGADGPGAAIHGMPGDADALAEAFAAGHAWRTAHPGRADAVVQDLLGRVAEAMADPRPADMPGRSGEALAAREAEVACSVADTAPEPAPCDAYEAADRRVLGAGLSGVCAAVRPLGILALQQISDRAVEDRAEDGWSLGGWCGPAGYLVRYHRPVTMLSSVRFGMRAVLTFRGPALGPGPDWRRIDGSSMVVLTGDPFLQAELHCRVAAEIGECAHPRRAASERKETESVVTAEKAETAEAVARRADALFGGESPDVFIFKALKKTYEAGEFGENRFRPGGAEEASAARARTPEGAFERDPAAAEGVASPPHGKAASLRDGLSLQSIVAKWRAGPIAAA